MRLFVTGGTGFVGSNFLARAAAQGLEIVALRRPGSQPRVLVPPNVKWVDAALDEDLSHYLRDVDCVVHFAAHTPNPPYAPLSECLYWNVLASVTLFEAAAAEGVRNFVVAGTCFEYGDAGEGQAFLHPGLDLKPRLSYPVSKAAASVALLGLARQHGLRMRLLRIFQVYGPGEAASRFWPSLRAAALAGNDFRMSAGEQVRDFIEVGDVVDRFIDALDLSGVSPGHPVVQNVGTGQGQTLLSFASKWWRELGAKGRLLPGATAYRQGENMRIVANIDDFHVA